MRMHNLLIGLLAIVVLAAGLLLVPRQEEQVTMLARDGYYEKASLELMRMRENGDHRPHILMQINTLRDRQGDVRGALTALDAYLALRPDDTSARERLADILLQSDDIDRYLSVIEVNWRTSGGMEEAERILALARLHGRHDTELHLLRGFAAHRSVSVNILARLGARLAQNEQWDEAIVVLKRYDQLAPADESHSRLLLLDALLEAGRADRAYTDAVRWTDAWRSPYLTAKVIVRLSQAGSIERAAALARRTVDVMPSATFAIADVLSRKGQSAVSRQLIRHWAEVNGGRSGDQMRDYVYAARMADDAGGAFGTLARMARSGAPDEIQARLAQELANAFGAGAVGLIRGILAPAVLHQRPLSAASLALLEGNHRLAEVSLAATDVATLDIPGQRQWLAMAAQLDGRAQLFDRLGRLWQEKRLPPMMTKAYAEYARTLSRADLHDAVWASLQLKTYTVEKASQCPETTSLMRIRQ